VDWTRVEREGVHMGWRAGDKAEGAESGKSKKGVYFILVGIVVAGAAAVWRWVRALPK
jgi:hypothetical protein